MNESLLPTVLREALAIIDVRRSRASNTLYAGLQLVFHGSWPFELLLVALGELEQLLHAQMAARGLGAVEIRREPLYARDALLLLRLRGCGTATSDDLDAALRATLANLSVLVAPRRPH